MQINNNKKKNIYILMGSSKCKIKSLKWLTREAFALQVSDLCFALHPVFFCLLAAVHVQFKTVPSLKTWNEAITLTASWQGVLNEGGWEPWSTIKALPLWSIWFLFTDACAGPVAVNPEDLPTIQGSSTLRIFLMEEMKCSKRVMQTLQLWFL